MSGWWDEAACIGKPIELFFPEKGGTSRPGKKICGTCEVRKECLADILKTEVSGGRDGTFGGMSAYEREKVFDGREHRSQARTHCRSGHEFTEDNILIFSGKRRCKICHGDEMKRKAERTHCINGHEFTPENTYMFKGSRRCKPCNRNRTSNWRQSQREQAS